MKLLFKLVTAPVIVALTLLVWICSAVLYCAAGIFGLTAAIISLLGVAVLLTYSPQNGLILLLIAFLVSPMGLPMAAARMIGKVQQLRYMLQDLAW